MLKLLNIESCPDRESVSILVGANGSGKSSFLRRLAAHHCISRNVVIVCNTPHDRFVGLRGARRISVGQTAGSPRTVVKRAVAQSLIRSDSTFHNISSTLNHCGYRARFGFLIDPGPLYGMSHDEIQFRQARQKADGLSDELEGRLSFLNGGSDLQDPDLGLALAFLQRHQPSDYVWVDPSETVLDFSRAREFAFVLKLESKLRGLNVLRGIHVFLQKSNTGPTHKK